MHISIRIMLKYRNYHVRNVFAKFSHSRQISVEFEYKFVFSERALAFFTFIAVYRKKMSNYSNKY